MKRKFILMGLSCLVCIIISGWQPLTKARENLLMGPYGDHIHPNSNQSDRIIAQSISLAETRQVVIDYPKTIWLGDNDQIRMTLEYAVEDLVLPGDSQNFQELYTLYDICIETRLDLPGISLEPEVPVRAVLVESQEMVFQWDIFPERSGNFRGNLWLYLVLYPKDENQEIQLPVLIFPVEISVTELLGVHINVARIAGWIGIVVSSIILFISIKQFDH